MGTSLIRKLEREFIISNDIIAKLFQSNLLNSFKFTKENIHDNIYFNIAIEILRDYISGENKLIENDNSLLSKSNLLNLSELKFIINGNTIEIYKLTDSNEKNDYDFNLDIATAFNILLLMNSNIHKESAQFLVINGLLLVKHFFTNSNIKDHKNLFINSSIKDRFRKRHILSYYLKYNNSFKLNGDTRDESC